MLNESFPRNYYRDSIDNFQEFPPGILPIKNLPVIHLVISLGIPPQILPENLSIANSSITSGVASGIPTQLFLKIRSENPTNIPAEIYFKFFYSDSTQNFFKDSSRKFFRHIKRNTAKESTKTSSTEFHQLSSWDSSRKFSINYFTNLISASSTDSS